MTGMNTGKIDAPPRDTADPVIASARLERWQGNLLDLTLRNRLLNFGSRSSSVRLLCTNRGRMIARMYDGHSIQIKEWPEQSEPDRSAYAKSLTRDEVYAELVKKDQRTNFQPRLLELYRQELKHLEETLPSEPAMACAVEDGDPVRQRVFVRGDYNNLGEEAPKRFPQILAGTEQDPISQGSGRLELARWLTGPEHPLTARVMVNRIWKWHFGQGLVRTPNNFGKLGTPPTHPQLLDYLARRFVREGWSIKKMHRLIMNSATYRMGSGTTPDKNLRDPQNQLLSRFERRRLEVEEIRDGLLSLDGSLDLAMGGTLQTGFGTDTENSNDRLSLKPETVHRRMVYVPLRRANLPTLLNLFDFGDATTSMGKRSHTNVAPQALFMMNSEFVADRARNLATRLEEENTDPARRIDRAYLITLNRMPEVEERQAALAYLGDFTGRFEGQKAPGLNAWGSFCRILMASNDFMYVD